MISLHKVVGLVLCVLTLAQVVHMYPDFVSIDTAEKLLREYESPTLAGAGLLIVSGFVVSLMAFFRSGGWRIGVIVVVGLYVWAVWYPDFLGLVLKYGASTAIAGIYDHARAAGTMGIAFLHNILYPLGFSGILLAVLWDSRPAGRRD
jgi:hypothetical protein